MSAVEPGDGAAPSGTQRLDKWLWFVRVVKTRTLAAALVTGGKIRLNRERIEKPSQLVRPGDVLTITAHARVRVLKVVAPGSRRGSPAEAKALFEDLTPLEPPRAATEPAVAGREPGSGRPTKRERRQLDKLMGGD
jgi:ribosome-associated heat shock protein Hsp15